jgi:sensor histidine kinase YesM
MSVMDRKWVFSLVWINVAVTVLAPLLQLAGNHAAGWKELSRIWAYILIYANVTGIPAVLLGQAMVERLARRKFPPAVSVVLVTMLFGAAGCLAAQTLLSWTGLAQPQRFWHEYLLTLRAAMLSSVAFGLGVFFYGSMRERLRETEAALYGKQMAEELVRKLALEARLHSLESRLHPHFLFNTLNSISALIAVNPARAEQIVGRLGALLRSSLDNTNQPLIPLEQELAMVEDYVDIEKARFGDKVRTRVSTSGDLQRAKVPPLSIQGLVENAVKHGITSQRGGGEVLITAAAENGSLRIEVSDTGPGFDLTAIPEGHGLDNLVGRLDTLFGAAGHLKVTRFGGRCVVEMVLPLS